ncbi:Cysteinyl-tRNA synthetase [Mycoplasma haemocanis str. Illinois]|uniref:Cysteine--tRNA ligase n=1 Tax=Mycoplasma haemocanis (strain Illinois) TaxID=1111676 RepID=H6N5X3_MYCHN|nr:cysteine--tRNA ligase [Mycoplasma haemocanis]AEW44888.1 Cysteinyl-tRNA synthetase [Mycoplasma haemocanis str. Illinois]
MSLKLYDSLEQKLKVLPKNPKIYLCGPTVYDYVHIGNVAPLIIFDFLIRYLEYKKENYLYIHNITDIDDKIINKAKELNLKEEEISNKFTDHYFWVMDELNVIKPTLMPKVSDHIEDIQRDISSLLEYEFAYFKDKDIVMDIGKIKNYGCLSKQNLNMLKSNENFCLWKYMESGKTWSSPWGNGRPGWHSECFSFINKYSKGGVDLHGGGIDLKFPHHENENAHSEALYSKSLSQIWMYIGHLQTQDGKISKSTNKRFLVKDLLKKHSANSLRYLFLTSKYSLPLLVDENRIEEVEKEFDSYLLAINQAKTYLYLNGGAINSKHDLDSEFLNIFENDLNLPEVLTWLQKLKKEILTGIKEKKVEVVSKGGSRIIRHLEFLGFKIENEHTIENVALIDEWRNSLINRDYSKADEIREILKRRRIL